MKRFSPLALMGMSAAFILSSVGMASALDTSVSPGLFIQKSGNTTGGVIVTQHLRSRSVHVHGFRTQISAAVPLATGGRYAATGELRKAVGSSSYVGAGAGIGRWDPSAGRTGGTYDILAGTRLARHTYLEGRLYAPITARVGHTGFVGVTFFL